MRLKSTPSRFMGENNSVLETSGDGLASDLDEIDRPIETDGGVVAQRDVQRESVPGGTKATRPPGVESGPRGDEFEEIPCRLARVDAGLGLDGGSGHEVELGLAPQALAMDAQQEIAAFAREVAADEEEARQAAPPFSGTEEREIDAWRHDRDVVGSATVIVAKRRLGPLGPGDETGGAPV